jgi:hypothetical protein
MMPVIKTAFENPARFTRGGNHGFGFVEGAAKGLFAENMLSSAHRGDADFGVSVRRGADEDDIDIVSRDGPLPVR